MWHVDEKHLDFKVYAHVPALCLVRVCPGKGLALWSIVGELRHSRTHREVARPVSHGPSSCLSSILDQPVVLLAGRTRPDEGRWVERHRMVACMHVERLVRAQTGL